MGVQSIFCAASSFPMSRFWASHLPITPPPPLHTHTSINTSPHTSYTSTRCTDGPLTGPFPVGSCVCTTDDTLLTRADHTAVLGVVIIVVGRVLRGWRAFVSSDWLSSNSALKNESGTPVWSHFPLFRVTAHINTGIYVNNKVQNNTGFVKCLVWLLCY